MSRLTFVLVAALLAVSAVAAEPKHEATTADTAANTTASTGTDATGATAPEVVNRMQKPEISTSALTGLLVGFTFLAIFVPGFLCLWNIQPPKTFEPIEKSDARKKAQ